MTVDWVQHGNLKAGGKRLEYGCFGPDPKEALTLVLLHEGLGCLGLWRDFPQALVEATDFSVFAYSRAGYGESDPADLPRPLDYLTREAKDVLSDVLELSGIQSCVLIGHSDGASIAAIYAGVMRDDRIKGAVLMAPHFFTEPVGLAEIAVAKTAFETKDLKQKLAKYHRNPENCFRGWCDSWLNPDFEEFNIADVLDDMPVPILAIQGENDQYATLAQIRVIEERSPSPVETLILPDCQHSPYAEKPQDVLDAIISFCRKI
jgi:pimeloyl-ACP methyl ester carboxylesterase